MKKKVYIRPEMEVVALMTERLMGLADPSNIPPFAVPPFPGDIIPGD